MVNKIQPSLYQHSLNMIKVQHCEYVYTAVDGQAWNEYKHSMLLNLFVCCPCADSETAWELPVRVLWKQSRGVDKLFEQAIKDSFFRVGLAGW